MRGQAGCSWARRWGAGTSDLPTYVHRTVLCALALFSSLIHPSPPSFISLPPSPHCHSVSMTLPLLSPLSLPLPPFPQLSLSHSFLNSPSPSLSSTLPLPPFPQLSLSLPFLNSPNLPSLCFPITLPPFFLSLPSSLSHQHSPSPSPSLPLPSPLHHSVADHTSQLHGLVHSSCQH